ncbi:MAG: cbb3-type cytochrome c oxidase subunit I [Acidobacteriota bacterium]|nr:cbb3-type cytochrome c oxidase subunit I [Acidobacteriota bacterium]MDE3043761.1 cbb3-type cytochrome c oxidase subunit I [Acidobacteriota bacterium]MDE3107220.1 cbb3-type cytochrome c oxidase subunit I [Acidobacteriota bacterium]
MVTTPPSINGAVRRGGWFSQHLGTALVAAIVGYLFGHWLGNHVAGNYPVVVNSGVNDVANFFGLLFGVIGWLLGIGALNYPLAKIAGRSGIEKTQDVEGFSKYFRYSTDHKTVGLQYVIGVCLFMFTGGLLAMAIRTELLNPTIHVFSPGTYIEIVSEHGTIMMMMATSIVLGPLGNYLVPLMIGSRRMAFPRIEAFSFWIFTAGYMVIFSALPYGGFPTGWTGYAPLQNQAGPGMISYLFGFAVIGLGMMTAGFNIAVTIVNYRAPGLTWSRVPMFVWSILATAALLTLATPVLFSAGLFGILDRVDQTAFYVAEHGGSSYLWENLFWFFGHPEVYIMALPAFGIVAEILPVFCRKPLFAQKVGAAGMIGVALLSFFVWQHHIFQSGINPDMRPLFMLTTELISIPTGFIFLVGMGTLYKAKIRYELPMLFSLALFFNFLIGGLTGVFLSDVPVNVTVHGGFFVLSHFHYTIMGGLLFAFMAGLYYWLPKMTGLMLNKKIGLWQFWLMFVFFNLTFFPMFIIGLLGQPRRVYTYAKNLQGLNDFSSISAFILGFSFLIFAWNLAYSWFIKPQKAPANPWDSLGLEWQTATPVPEHNFDRIPVIMTDPYHYSEPGAQALADLGGVGSSTGNPA